MTVTWISDRVGYQEGAVNVGFVRLHGDQALLLDAGLDSDRARRVIRDLEQERLRARVLLLTHSHADHMGGADTLRRRCPLKVAAPMPEVSFVRHPALEPFYLYGGAAAPTPLTAKFLQAEGCAVDVEVKPGPWRLLHSEHHQGATTAGRADTADDGPLRLELLSLAGHSPGQVGLAVFEGAAEAPTVVFCADAVFPERIWRKHGFVYFSDVQTSLDTIARLRTLRPTALVAGHGYADRERVGPLLEANQEGLEQATAAVAEAVAARPEGATSEDLLVSVAEAHGVDLGSPSEYVLARAALNAHLTRLEAAGTVTLSVVHGRMTWTPVGG